MIYAPVRQSRQLYIEREHGYIFKRAAACKTEVLVFVKCGCTRCLSVVRVLDAAGGARVCRRWRSTSLQPRQLYSVASLQAEMLQYFSKYYQKMT